MTGARLLLDNPPCYKLLPYPRSKKNSLYPISSVLETVRGGVWEGLVLPSKDELMKNGFGGEIFKKASEDSSSFFHWFCWESLWVLKRRVANPHPLSCSVSMAVCEETWNSKCWQLVWEILKKSVCEMSLLVPYKLPEQLGPLRMPKVEQRLNWEDDCFYNHRVKVIFCCSYFASS